MTQPWRAPVPKAVFGAAEEDIPFHGIHVDFDNLEIVDSPDDAHSQRAAAIETALSTLSMTVRSPINGDAVTVGFTLAVTGGWVGCWMSARIIDGKLTVRSWTEGQNADVDHRIDNPNPHWYSPTSRADDNEGGRR